MKLTRRSLLIAAGIAATGASITGAASRQPTPPPSQRLKLTEDPAHPGLYLIGT